MLDRSYVPRRVFPSTIIYKHRWIFRDSPAICSIHLGKFEIFLKLLFLSPETLNFIILKRTIKIHKINKLDISVNDSYLTKCL